MLVKKMKRSLAAVLTAALMMSLLPMNVLAVAVSSDYNMDENQVVHQGSGNVYFKPSDAPNVPTGNAGNYAVMLGKTIEKAGENEFDITLTVKTKGEETVNTSLDSAVVLVLDVSGSMKDCAVCGKSHDHYTHDGEMKDYCPTNNGETYEKKNNQNLKCKHCKESPQSHALRVIEGYHAYQSRMDVAKASANEFLTQYVKDAGNAKRWVSVVTFGDDGNTVLSWTDANAGHNNSVNTSVTTTLNNINAQNEGTCLEAGMMLARNLLIKGLRQNGDIEGTGNTNVILLTDGVPTCYVPGDPHDEKKIVGQGGGVVCNYNDYVDIPTRAQEIMATNSGKTDLFALTYAVSDKVNGKTIENWLKNDVNIPEDHISSTNTPVGLSAALAKINQTITNSTVGATVTDPMGAGIKVKDFTPSNGVTLDQETNTLTWDLSQASYQESTTSAKTFSYTYHVTFDSSIAKPDSNEFAANGAAKLEYRYNNNGTETNKAALFPVPKVKALFTDVSFTKVNPNGDPISGAVFKLTGPGEGNAVCREGVISDEDGTVTFPKIPTGHTYKLVEVSAPEPYDATSAGTHTVEVKDGNVIIRDENSDIISNQEIVNTYLPGNQSIEVQKIWRDGDVVHPNSNITLFRDGTVVGTKPIGGDNDDLQTVTFQVAQRDTRTGEDIHYTFDETDANGNSVTPQGYSKMVSAESNTITNTRSNDQKQIVVNKTWVNASGNSYDQDITITLTGTGTFDGKDDSKTWIQTLAADQTSVTFTNLPEFDSMGECVSYTASDDVEGYAPATGAEVNGAIHLRNQLDVSQTIQLSGNVVWKDDHNTDGDRPASVKVQFMNGDTLVDEPIAVSGVGDTWAFSKALPKYEEVRDGNNVITAYIPIVYSIRQLTESNKLVRYGETDYSVNYGESYQITNTRTGLADLTIEKVWDDSDNSYDTRPDDITVKLLADGTELPDLAQTSSDDEFTFAKLPKYDSEGRRIVYTVTDSAPGYEATYNADTRQLTNKLLTAKGISGTKVWRDNGNIDSTRPSSIDVELVGDDEKVYDVITVTAPEGDGNTDTWAFCFEDMPKFRTETEVTAGTQDDPNTEADESTADTTETSEVEIVYSVREKTKLSDYQTEYGEKYSIINTLKPGAVTISVNKNWVDEGAEEGRPAVSFTLQAEQNGAFVNIESKDYQNDDLSFTAHKYDAAGNRIAYSVIETMPADTQYSQSNTGMTKLDNGNLEISFTNTLSPDIKTVFNGTKAWVKAPDVETPDSITVQLYKNGEALGEPRAVTLGQGGVFSIDDLPKYTVSNGIYTKNVYSVKEVDGEKVLKKGQSITIDGTTYVVSYNNQGNVITNKQKQEKTSVEITKSWADPVGTKHPVATFTLYQNGKVHNTWQTTLDSTAASETHIFKNLPLYSKDRQQRYTYTVKETGVPEGYHLDEENSTNENFINIIDQKDVTISGSKTWTDTPDKALPDSIQVDLYRNGTVEPIESVTVEPDENGQWSYSFQIEDGMYDESGNYVLYHVQEVGANTTYDTPRITYGEDPFIFSVSYGEVTRDSDGNMTANIENTCLNHYFYNVTYKVRTQTIDSKESSTYGDWVQVDQMNGHGEKGDLIALTAKNELNYDGQIYTLMPDEGTHSVTLSDPQATPELSFFYQRSVHSYSVSYQWTGCSSDTLTLPTSSKEYFPGETVDVDESFKAGTTHHFNYNTYEFSGWEVADVAEGMPSNNVVLTGSWEIIDSDDATYQVKHYLKNLDGEGYTLQETQTMSGKSHQTATAAAKEYKGYVEETSNPDWKADGTIQGDHSLILKLFYTPGTNTPYTLESYYQLPDGSYGAEPDSKDSSRNGTTGSGVTVSEKDKTPDSDHPSFIWDENNALNVTSGTINGDGSLVLKLYFKRQYVVSYQPGEGGAFQEQKTTTLSFGDPTPAAPTIQAKQDYIFTGWDKEIAQKVTQDAVYVAQWRARSSGGGGGGGGGGGIAIPAQYTVTVHYQDQDGANLRDDYTQELESGAGYDVASQTQIEISGYSIQSVQGSVRGQLRSDVEITVIYAAEEVVIDDGETPLSDQPNQPSDEASLEDGLVPKGSLPAGMTAADGIIILDDGVPLGNLPQTGTASEAATPWWNTGMLILAISMAAIGFTVSFGRKKDEEK